MVCCSCIHHLPFMHQCEVVKLFEDGVSGLVDGEDHSLASSGQPSYIFGHFYYIDGSRW